MTDEALDALLEATATAPVPAPSAAFVDRLDADLRVGHADAMMEAAPGAGGRAVRRAALLWAVAGLVVAVLVVTQLRSTDSGGLVLLDGDQVTAVLPDGREEPASPGDEIPVGAVVTVGPSGFAEFPGFRLGPGTVARITDRGVEIEPDEPPPDVDLGVRAPTRPQVEPERESEDRARPGPTTTRPAEPEGRGDDPTTARPGPQPDRVRRPGETIPRPPPERDDRQTTTTVASRTRRTT